MPEEGPKADRSPKPVVPRPRTVEPRRVAPRPSPRPTGPISLETVSALAKKERVPLRIAKGELEGKMKCRIWRKLHAEEARRFDQAYALVAQHPQLSLADAFGVLQSGLTVEELQARRLREQKRAQVKEARGELPSAAIHALLSAWMESKTELSIVLAERAVADVLEAELPVALKLARTGRVEKLKVVLAAPRTLWESLAGAAERETRRMQRPVPVAREPERRPYADPRAFLPYMGKEVHLLLRNGIRIAQPLAAIGPFDLVLGGTTPETAIFVPLHAVLEWEEGSVA